MLQRIVEIRVLAVAATVAVVIGGFRDVASAAADATFAGSLACRPCHEAEYAAWASSSHSAAMREANVGADSGLLEATAAFGKNAASRAEIRKNSGAWTATVREGGSPAATYPLRYILGGRVLAQPVVQGDLGRLQALSVGCQAGTREWFDIFSGEERLPGEFGHWLGAGMNANSHCIECHAVHFEKNYDPASDRYATTWAEPGVGCEACHGPGSDHVKAPALPYSPFGKSAGIAALLPRPPVPGARPGESRAPAPPAAGEMLDTCATCHSVRRPIAGNFRPGDRFLDHYEPVLLDEPLYHASGAVASEAYEWGSFVQSRMYAAGVTCLACHDVHSGKLRASGNDLCLTCHATSYAEVKHTAHESGPADPACVSCHMPEKVFMARDSRRDHSLSVPDPIGAQASGSPSACETCHADRGQEKLATDAARLWPNLEREPFVSRRAVAKAFAQAKRGKAECRTALADCISGKTCTTSILRASAARLSAGLPGDGRSEESAVEILGSQDALVRASAAYALGNARLDDKSTSALLLAARDPVRAVRVNAAWALRATDRSSLEKEEAATLGAAFQEWRVATLETSEAPESWHAIGIFESTQGDAKASEAAYRKAIAIDPHASASRYNLAMLMVDLGRIEDARKELEALVAADGALPAAWYALGMIQGEQKEWQAAARSLGQCLKLDQDYPGVLQELTQAYLEAGVPNVARVVLTQALNYPPARKDALRGMLAVAIKAGTHEEVLAAASALVSADPTAAQEPIVAALLASETRTDGSAGSTTSLPTGPTTQSETKD